MTNITHIQFHIGDFLSGVMQMDGSEIGAYTMLLMAHYQAGEEGLPDDNKKLMQITRTNPKVWNRIKDTVLAKFHLENGFWKHERVIEEIEKIKSKAGPGRPKATDKVQDGNPKVDFEKTTSDSQVENKSLILNDTEKTNQKPITITPHKPPTGGGDRPSPKTENQGNDPLGPDEFMAAYPEGKRTGIGAVRSAWATQTQFKGADPVQIVTAARNFAAQCRREKTEDRFIPKPARFLSDQMYLDPALQETKPDAPSPENFTPWQKRIAALIGDKLTGAWFHNATLSGDRLICRSRFQADHIRQNYGAAVSSALGDHVRITHEQEG